jgi:cystathionine beta-lyase/cystathionine gamma-synthase
MPPRQARSRRAPIYRDSGYRFETIDEAGEAFRAEAADPQSAEQFIYTRWGNPTVMETEAAIARLEGSAWAMLASSGMAAIDIAFSTFEDGASTGTWLFFSEIYGSTTTYLDQVMARRRGVSVERFKPDGERFDLAALEAALDRVKPSLLFFEALTNPLLIVVDAAAVIKAAKDRGVRVIVDNTFCTPLLWKPLAHGADLVMHSATKYFGGHGNITAGVVAGDDPKLRLDAMTYRKLVGHILSPDDAYRLGTQIKTLPLRYARQCDSALRLARLLEDHPQVAGVRYPGLDTHLTHAEAVRLFEDRGFGAMITFELKGGRAACDGFVEAVGEHIAYITTLGDAESILMHVPSTFGADKYPYPGMLRLSVGFEPYAELEAHVLAALSAIR